MRRRALAVGAWRQEHGHEQWIEVEGTGRGGHAHCNSKMSDDDEEEIVLLKGPAVTLDDGGRGAVVADGVAREGGRLVRWRWLGVRRGDVRVAYLKVHASWQQSAPMDASKRTG